MKKFLLKKIEGEALDPTLSAEARRMYLPPAVARGDQGYWSALEQRIMARVADPAFLASLEQNRWWTVLEGWSRAGLVAAGILVAVSAALLQNQTQEENSAVYEYVSATPAPEAFAPSVDLATQREAGIQNDAVFNYVLAR
jgi:hypothetical protein